MDDQLFDQITRVFAAAPSRRGVIRSLAGGALSGSLHHGRGAAHRNGEHLRPEGRRPEHVRVL